MATGVEIVSAHHERAVVRIGDMFLKVDVDEHRVDVEVAAMALANVPTPRVLWHQGPVLALAAVPGVQLGRLGEPITTSPAAWEAAGAAARELHSAPLPPWPGWRADGFAGFVDLCCRYLVDNEVVDAATVGRVRRIVDPALRPYPHVFTHGDFQPAHVFVDEDTVVAILDWSDACQGDALFDLAVLTTGFAERLDDVVRGYGSDVDRDVIRGWWAARRLSAVPWMIDHGFDATGDIAALRGMSDS